MTERDEFGTPLAPLNARDLRYGESVSLGKIAERCPMAIMDLDQALRACDPQARLFRADVDHLGPSLVVEMGKSVHKVEFTYVVGLDSGSRRRLQSPK